MILYFFKPFVEADQIGLPGSWSCFLVGLRCCSCSDLRLLSPVFGGLLIGVSGTLSHLGSNFIFIASFRENCLNQNGRENGGGAGRGREGRGIYLSPDVAQLCQRDTQAAVNPIIFYSGNPSSSAQVVYAAAGDQRESEASICWRELTAELCITPTDPARHTYGRARAGARISHIAFEGFQTRPACVEHTCCTCMWGVREKPEATCSFFCFLN